MARSTKSSTKPAVLDETVEETETEVTAKSVINEGIQRVIEATGIDVQKNRYKAMRAIAFQAFVESIEADDFDGLVERALENIDDLPAGWEIEKQQREATPAPKASKPATKKAPAKAATKAPAKTGTARRRPQR